MYLSTINKNDAIIRPFKKMVTQRDWSANLYNLDIESSMPRRFGVFTNKVDFINKVDDIERTNPKILHYPLNKPEYNLTNAQIMNNCKKMLTNMSGNNIIYAPKKVGLTRVRCHEKTLGNIYSNMSYDPSRIKRMNESSYKKNKGANYSNNLYSRKRNDLDMHHFIEKNNSFCGDINNY